MQERGKSDTERPWSPRTFLERVGAALAAPSRALAAADSELNAGKTGTDAALLILLSLLAIHTRELVAVSWLGYADGYAVAANLLAATVSDAVVMDLVFLCVAGLGLFIAAGSRRSIGRDFDLACVAFTPFLAVQLVAALGFRLSGTPGGGRASYVVTAIAWAWGLVVLVLAHRVTRARGAVR